jgi:hypothetical protein
MDPPKSITYAFLLVVLTGINLIATDAGNANLNVLPRKWKSITADPKFGSELEGWLQGLFMV